MHDILGNRSIVVSRELTKKFEEFTRGSVSEVLALYEEQGIKGECCIIIEGSSEEVSDDTESWWQDLSILEHVQQVMETEGHSSKEAIKLVSKERNLPKRDVYQAFHVE